MTDGSFGAGLDVLRTVAFFDVLDYPPTEAEASAWRERRTSGRQDVGGGIGDLASVSASPGVGRSDDLIQRASLTPDVLTSRRPELESSAGRLAMPGRLDTLLPLVRECTALFPRKIRAARRVAKWLARNPAVRFVAVANTTALAHARDKGDLDFFVVVRHGHIWTTRLLGGAPYRVSGRLSGPRDRPDAVCLSYFVSDAALNLSPHMLEGDDPYFRYWFLALLPLYDDGVSRDLWNANAAITRRHPSAEPWIVSPDLTVRRPALRIPVPRFLEPWARRFQQNWFPPAIRERLGKGNDVIADDHALKFHVDDGRRRYREMYWERLKALGVE